MKIVRVQDIIGTEREVTGPGWTSRRMLLKKDGMGFSYHETIIPAGAELNLWYKHHLEAFTALPATAVFWTKPRAKLTRSAMAHSTRWTSTISTRCSAAPRICA